MTRQGHTIPSTGLSNTKVAYSHLGVVSFGADGTLEKVWTRYGEKAANPWLDVPLPNVTYHVLANRSQHAKGVRLHHIYRTDSLGSTYCAEAINVKQFRGSEAGQRWNSKPVGYPGSPFDRGHIIAREFGAGMESVNLVTMPSSVNQAHRAATALKRGFDQNAELLDSYLNPEHISGGTPSGSGEFYLPNYRKFEQAVTILIKRGEEKGFEVCIRVRPATFDSAQRQITDILHAEIWAGDQPILRYKIDSDLSSGS